MAGFLEPLSIREIPGDNRRWILLEPCVYVLKSLKGDEWVDAEIGFITDFGSIPRLLWSFPGLSPFGKYRRAYVIHDKLFIAPVVRTVTLSERVIDFTEANDILIEAMQVLGAGWFLRKVIWLGVRFGGKVVWNRYREKENE